MLNIVICPYCNNPAELLLDSSCIYKKNYGPIYRCDPCKAHVHAHEQSLLPMGTLANQELRNFRIKGHKIFDKMWKKLMKKMGWSEIRARTYLYGSLAKALNLPDKDCHFGLFDIPLCKLAIHACKNGYIEKPPSDMDVSEKTIKSRMLKAKLKALQKKKRVKVKYKKDRYD